ncbi:putative lipase ROG1 [Tasmannia lanceolata]|uniref:putative lipase ROG1 n=1 Tax=Tasmannia lanceolata TaxID=3420 RepID=UPI004063EB12
MIGTSSLAGTVNLGGLVPDKCRICYSSRIAFTNLGFGLRSSYQDPKQSSEGSRMDFARWIGCFNDPRVKKGRKLEVDSVPGGEDVWDSKSSEPKFPEHLVVMVNGIIGSAEDWRYAAEQFVKRLPDKVIVHRSECNSSRLTFDGVDLMGERLAEEVLSVVRRRPGVQKISFVAHSLGGLVARYAVGRLYLPIPDSEASVDSGNFLSEEHMSPRKSLGWHREGRVAGLEPMNFITFATPHLGSRGNKQLPFLCGLPFLERRASQTAHWVAGRTGKHLFLTDNDDERPPLLLRMVNDSNDLKFMSALRSFKCRVAYANANFDHMVGWRTSSIRRQHELPKHHVLVKDEKYQHIVYVERENEHSHTNTTSHIEGQAVDLEEEMIRGLNQVSWKRVDVSFHKSKQRYIAHNTIQVKNYWMNSDGADVVFHMIDNFLI